MAKDLVCGMQVDKQNPPGTSEYKGTTYYFCSIPCKKKFDRDPEKYVQAESDQSGQ